MESASLPEPMTDRLVRLQQGFHIPVLRNRHAHLILMQCHPLIHETSHAMNQVCCYSKSLRECSRDWSLTPLQFHKHPKPQKPKHSNNYYYWCRAVSQSVQRKAVKGRRAGRVATSLVSEALCRGGGGDLLQNPVTVAGALGLWSFISGGIVRGARERLNTESRDERHERGTGE